MSVKKAIIFTPTEVERFTIGEVYVTVTGEASKVKAIRDVADDICEVEFENGVELAFYKMPYIVHSTKEI